MVEPSDTRVAGVTRHYLWLQNSFCQRSTLKKGTSVTGDQWPPSSLKWSTILFGSAGVRREPYMLAGSAREAPGNGISKWVVMLRLVPYLPRLCQVRDPI